MVARASSLIKLAKAGNSVPGGSFQDLLKNAGIGALFSGGLTTLYTGNPLIGAIVGAADLFGSAGAADFLGKKFPKWAGGYSTSRATDAKGNFLPDSKPVTNWAPSTQQHVAMGITSIAAPMVVEPLLTGGTQPPYTDQQYLTQRVKGDKNPHFQQMLNSGLNDPDVARKHFTEDIFRRYGL